MAYYAELFGILICIRCISSLGFIIFRKTEDSFSKILEIHLGVWILTSVLNALGGLEGSTMERWNQLTMVLIYHIAAKILVQQIIIMFWDLIAFKFGSNQKWIHKISGGLGAIILLSLLTVYVAML